MVDMEQMWWWKNTVNISRLYYQINKLLSADRSVRTVCFTQMGASIRGRTQMGGHQQGHSLFCWEAVGGGVPDVF